MSPTQVAEEEAQAKDVATPSAPTADLPDSRDGEQPEGAEQPKADAAAKPTDPAQAVAEMAKRLEKSERDSELARKGQSADKKEFNRQLRESQAKIARLEAELAGNDPDVAERAVRKQHTDDDAKAVSTSTQEAYKSQWDQNVKNMGAAIAALGLDWETAPELEEVREDWQDDWDTGRVRAAARLVRKVQAMQKAAPAPKNGAKSAAKSAADLDQDGGGSGFSAGMTDEEFDKLTPALKVKWALEHEKKQR